MGDVDPESANVGASADAREQHRFADLIANDEVVRRSRPRKDVQELLRSEQQCLAEDLAAIMERYADRPALGQRAHRFVRDPATGRTSRELLPEYTTISYAQLWSRVRAVAAEFRAHEQRPFEVGSFVCLLGFTSADYATLELACLHLGAVSVPLHNSAPVGQLEPIVAETEPVVLATSLEFLDNAVELATGSACRPRVVVFDFASEVDDEREKFERASRRTAEAGIPLEALADVLDRGDGLPAPEPAKGDADRLALLVYTSGSTGAPKGAMYPERLVRRLTGFLTRMDTPAITVSYTPMSHLAGRSSVLSSLARGGITCFTAKSDQSVLFEDVQLVRPTELALVPRVCDMLLEHYQSERQRRSGEFADEQALDIAVKQDLRENFLGGRIVRAVIGSAAIAPEMASFLESALDLPLHNDYGSTEAGGITMDTRVLRPPVSDYKLDDVPELGYFSTDSPHPRGELLVKTENIFPGYFKRPEVTAEVFDEGGYYRTGDIMAEVGPDRLVYVDRRTNVLKLSQGEFVALSRLEAVFATSPLVLQIFVYGNSARSYLLAVIVPTAEALERFGSGASLKAAMGESLQHVANEAELSRYEIPRDYLVETTPFSTANGLLSDARKSLRPRLTERYGDRLEQLYTELADREAAELRGLRRSGRDKPALETVSRAAQALLGCSSTDLTPQTRFTDLGGDSFSALSYSNLLQEIFDVQLPVGVVIGPTNDLRAIAEHIEVQRCGGVERAGFAAVHGADVTQVRASELTLDKFIPESTLEAATSLPGSIGDPNTVLLTGANGYLGRFLCLDWLEQLATTGGKLVCIVRGADADAARERLGEAFDSGDAELLQRYRRLADQHLEVLPGDLEKPNLGLDERTWQRLTTEVDLVLHLAALVNHVLPYRQLFGPNVGGTAAIIRMAVTSRIKPVIYLSTVGVASHTASSALDESGDIRVTNPRRALHDGYANGYATSKWAGEVLMREAHDRCGVPVAVFRLDLIMAHSRYTGQLNAADMFTRLLLSLVATGIAPSSFYAGADGSRPRAHYDGLPADFAAEAITALGSANTDGYRTYNVLNPHDDGISLDVFVDWLIEAGQGITRIDDFGEWVRRFETAMRELPERQRQHSLLPLLHAFQEPEPAVPGSAIPADRFREAVQRAGIGAARDIPLLSAGLIIKYVHDLQQLDLL